MNPNFDDKPGATRRLGDEHHAHPPLAERLEDPEPADLVTRFDQALR